MSSIKIGLVTAAKEHLAEGLPLTRLEAIVLFGVPDLTKLVSEMRRDGWVITSKKIPYAKALRRVNEFAVLTPPKNLPIREIPLTEYQVSK